MKFPRGSILLATAAIALSGGGATAFVLWPDLGIRANASPATSPQAHPSHRQVAAQSGLPGGASSLQETYEDWQVVCASQGEAKRCVMAQQQADPTSRQRVLALELEAAGGGHVGGMLVLPFGLALDAGVTLRVDEGDAGEPLRFRTCLPAGCVVPVEFGESLVAAMRGGTTLQVTATPSENPQPVIFSVSLRGFSGALDRIVSLVT